MFMELRWTLKCTILRTDKWPRNLGTSTSKTHKSERFLKEWRRETRSMLFRSWRISKWRLVRG
jgi:hypothetical protein